MSKNHDRSELPSPRIPSQAAFRPAGAVSLFGGNSGLFGEMKARLRPTGCLPNEESDSDNISKERVENRSPGNVVHGSVPSILEPPGSPKCPEGAPISLNDRIPRDQSNQNTWAPVFRRHATTTSQDRSQQRTQGRVRSMYVQPTHTHLTDPMNNRSSTEALSANLTVNSRDRLRTTSGSFALTTTTNPEPLLPSLTKDRVRKPHRRPPTIYLSHVPSSSENKEVLDENFETQGLQAFFGDQLDADGDHTEKINR